jgi:hypothetical protein
MESSPRRKRKVVTVLFSGFTSRTETLDPEDVEAILAPYHRRLRAELKYVREDEALLAASA